MTVTVEADNPVSALMAVRESGPCLRRNGQYTKLILTPDIVLANYILPYSPPRTISPIARISRHPKNVQRKIIVALQ